MKQWAVDILMKDQTGEKLEHLKLTDDGTFLKLGDKAKLFVVLNELWIERIGETPVEMIRGTRKRMLKPAHPMRVLIHDQICMEASECLVQKIYRLNSGDALISRFGKMSNKARIFGAAAAMMVVIPACSPAALVNGDSIKCYNGNAMCLSNNRYQCENFRWKLVEQCQAPASCELVDKKTTICENAGPCENGNYTCFGHTIDCEADHDMNCGYDRYIYKCENNQWVLQDQCGYNGKCELKSDTEATCVAVEQMMGIYVGGKECDSMRSGMTCGYDNAIRECNRGYWYYKEVCTEPDICKEMPNGEAICVKPDETE